MQEEMFAPQSERKTPAPEPVSPPEQEPAPSLREQALALSLRFWRPAGTVVAVLLAALLMGHVINGNHGLSFWHQKRAEDRELQKEIQDIQQENAQLRKQVDRLKSDPDAIEHEAREKLHYAKPGEVIYSLPATPTGQTAPAK
jgi:cell division protein FtsB